MRVFIMQSIWKVKTDNYYRVSLIYQEYKCIIFKIYEFSKQMWFPNMKMCSAFSVQCLYLSQSVKVSWKSSLLGFIIRCQCLGQRKTFKPRSIIRITDSTKVENLYNLKEKGNYIRKYLSLFLGKSYTVKTLTHRSRWWERKTNSAK